MILSFVFDNKYVYNKVDSGYNQTRRQYTCKTTKYINYNVVRVSDQPRPNVNQYAAYNIVNLTI